MNRRQLLAFVPAAPLALAQESAPELSEPEKEFQESLNNVTLQGFFTHGESKELHEDRYVIERVTKDKGDLWRFEGRIQYNKRDIKVAMPLPVKWAGDTPVISLTDFQIPGSGKYTARVVIYKGDYAGTWAAGTRRGGILFGKIVKNAAVPAPGPAVL